MGERAIIVQEVRSALDKLREKDMAFANNRQAVISRAAALRGY